MYVKKTNFTVTITKSNEEDKKNKTNRKKKKEEVEQKRSSKKLFAFAFHTHRDKGIPNSKTLFDTFTERKQMNKHTSETTHGN